MKKILSTILVAMHTNITMLIMTSGVVVPPPVVTWKSEFVIRNLNTDETKTVETKEFSMEQYNVYFGKGIHEGDWLEITYKPWPTTVPHQAKWTYRWGSSSAMKLPDGLTANVHVTGASHPSNNTLIVECEYYEVEQPDNSTTYTMNFPNVRKGNQITVKNSDASEVRVTYADYEEVSSGQRATVALYDIYGNLVSTGYLDALGTGTLSTKRKSGIYIVKVMMNNQVIFNQRIQVK